MHSQQFTDFSVAGLTLSLRGIAIANQSDVRIIDVGLNYPDEEAIICRTDLMACCNSAASGGSRRGNWTFPNGSAVGGSGARGDMFVTRDDLQQVVLQRRNNALGPLGTYCCMVETNSHPNGASICVNLGKIHALC